MFAICVLHMHVHGKGLMNILQESSPVNDHPIF